MGHKINPTGLRLGITQEHRSRWYASSKNYPALLQEDDRIRKFIHKIPMGFDHHRNRQFLPFQGKT